MAAREYTSHGQRSVVWKRLNEYGRSRLGGNCRRSVRLGVWRMVGANYKDSRALNARSALLHFATPPGYGMERSSSSLLVPCAAFRRRIYVARRTAENLKWRAALDAGEEAFLRSHLVCPRRAFAIRVEGQIDLLQFMCGATTGSMTMGCAVLQRLRQDGLSPPSASR